MEVLISEVEARKNVLFGTLSSGKRKRSRWERVGSENRTQAEVKKKWSDIKVDVKRTLAAHRRSVVKTGEGAREEGPTLFEQRVGAIMGDTALSEVEAVAVLG